MSDFSLFLGKFFKHGTAIASLAPSSRWLSRTTVRNIPWDRAKVARRAGRGHRPDHPGPGREGPPDCRVVVLERDPDFARLLHERFDHLPNFDVVEGDVRDLTEILADRGIGQVDYVISGLPVPSFPSDLQRDLFRVGQADPRPRGDLQPDHRDALGLLAVLQAILRRRPLRLRAAQLPPAGAYFCRGVKDLP